MARRYALAFVIVWTSAAVLALAWGTVYNWPDYVHVTYGYPFVWGNHTLDTIAGPVDKWYIDMEGLVGDSLFWLGFLVVGAHALLRWRGPMRSDSPA